MEEELKPNLSLLASLGPDSFIYNYICHKNEMSSFFVVPSRYSIDVDGKTFGDFISFLRSQMKLEKLDLHKCIPVHYYPPSIFFKISLLTNSWFEEKVFDDEFFLEPEDCHPESGKEHYILRRSRRYITLSIEMIPPYCVHVAGYAMQNGEPWLEFATYSCSIHCEIIPTFLDFFGDYASLERACGEKRENIELGRTALIKAVETLATSTKRQERARSLLVVIQMICESIKSSYIREFLVRHYESGVFPDEIMLAEEMFGQEAFKSLNIYDPGLVPEHKKCKVVTSGCRALEAVEIFAVYIDGEDQCNLYGTIKVMKGEHSQYIYEREKDCAEAMRQNDTALLTGPTRSISAEGPFTLYVGLKDKDREDEFICGELDWSPYNFEVYDKPLTRYFASKHHLVKLVYGVITHALAATFEVKLMKGNRGVEEPAKIYGQITVANASYFTDHESLLFRIRKDSGDQVEVSPGQLIPLSRSVVAVPVNTQLIFCAELYDFDSNDVIVKAKKKFPLLIFPDPQTLNSTYEEIISGEYGKIQVKVNWSLPE